MHDAEPTSPVERHARVHGRQPRLWEDAKPTFQVATEPDDFLAPADAPFYDPLADDSECSQGSQGIWGACEDPDWVSLAAAILHRDRQRDAGRNRPSPGADLR